MSYSLCFRSDCMLNSRQYIEKRDFMRMALNCPVNYESTLSRRGKKTGTCVDLSANGISFLCDDKISVGDELDISVKPQLAISPPFNATMTVIRVEQQGLSNTYSIAGIIKLMS